MDLSRIAEIICETAIAEDNDLRELAASGIFHMPELAFAYQCGKSILREAEAVFGNKAVAWKREESLGNGGPTDLVFELETGETLAIEFKLRNNAAAYERDIVKLGNIEREKTTKLFCALIDVFKKDLPDDGRQRHLECLTGYQVTPVKKVTFYTEKSWYQSPTACVVCVWSVA